MFLTLMSFMGGSAVRYCLYGLLAALLAGVCWDCYSAKQDASFYKTQAAETAVKLETANTQLENAAEMLVEVVLAADEREASYRSDLELSAQEAQEQVEELQALYEKRNQVKNIKRPEHEKSCPIHPAIGAAFSILRAEANATSSSTNSTQGRG